MKTKAARLYGAGDLRIEEFELPEITENEVLIQVISDTLCASTYKAVKQGAAHKRVPNNVSENPIVIGHEMCGIVQKAGDSVKDKWTRGQKVIIHPALKLESNFDPGYSYPYIGGNMTYAIVPEVVLERGCMIPYNGEGFFKGSLVEPVGCVLRAFKGMYHTDYTDYTRVDGVKRGGKLAILGGAGPMGLAAVDLAVNYAGCAAVVVTDINEERLSSAIKAFPPEKAAEKGVKLIYLNTCGAADVVTTIKNAAGGAVDDVFVMVPDADLVPVAERIAGNDGCINFFAGPAIHDFPGSLNMYRVHYDGIHLLGTAGSIPQDAIDTICLIENKVIDPAVTVSHIFGLNAIKDAVFDMEKPNGLKKVCYPGIDLPMTAISDFAELGKTNPVFAELDRIVKKNGGLWCSEAEAYLLSQYN